MTTDGSRVRSAGATSIFKRWHFTLTAAAILVTALVMFLRIERATEVETVSPTTKDIESTVSATGTVIPMNDFPARATFAGIVDRIYVHLGERVHPGQMLIQMRDQYAESRLDNARTALLAAELNKENLLVNGTKEERIRAASDLEQANSEQVAATHALTTLEQLQQVGSASDAEVSAATERLRNANAALAAAQQRSQSRYGPDDLKHAQSKVAAEQASLAAEKVSFANAYISSPIRGTVYLLPVRRYDFVQMGNELLHVADLSKILVRANFFEPDIKQINVGEPVNITWNGAPGRTWQGTIQSRPMAVNGEGVLRTGQCTIAVSGDTEALPMNTNVTVVVAVEKHQRAMTLPREAVHDDGSNYYVFRVVDSHLERTPVKVGLLNATDIEITNGITTRDQIALRAKDGEKLKNDLRVRLERRS